MRRHLLFLALFILSCVPAQPKEPCIIPPNNHYIFCIDAQFSQSQQLSIKEATQDWEQAICHSTTLTTTTIDGASPIPPTCNAAILNAHSSYPWIIQATNQETLGFTNHVGGNYAWLITDRISEARFFYVARHEIGHLLGVTHQTLPPFIQHNQGPITQPQAIQAARFLGNLSCNPQPQTIDWIAGPNK